MGSDPIFVHSRKPNTPLSTCIPGSRRLGGGYPGPCPAAIGKAPALRAVRAPAGDARGKVLLAAAARAARRVAPYRAHSRKANAPLHPHSRKPTPRLSGTLPLSRRHRPPALRASRAPAGDARGRVLLATAAARLVASPLTACIPGSRKPLSTCIPGSRRLGGGYPGPCPSADRRAPALRAVQRSGRGCIGVDCARSHPAQPIAARPPTCIPGSRRLGGGYPGPCPSAVGKAPALRASRSGRGCGHDDKSCGAGRHFR